MDFVLPVPPRSYTQLNSPARHCPSQVIYWQHKALLTDLRSITIGFIPKFRINLQNPPCTEPADLQSAAFNHFAYLPICHSYVFLWHVDCYFKNQLYTPFQVLRKATELHSLFHMRPHGLSVTECTDLVDRRGFGPLLLACKASVLPDYH